MYNVRSWFNYQNENVNAIFHAYYIALRGNILTTALLVWNVYSMEKEAKKTVTKHFMRSKAQSGQHHHRKKVKDFHAIVTEYTWSRLAWRKNSRKEKFRLALRAFAILKGRSAICEVRLTHPRKSNVNCTPCVFCWEFWLVSQSLNVNLGQRYSYKFKSVVHGMSSWMSCPLRKFGHCLSSGIWRDLNANIMEWMKAATID